MYMHVKKLVATTLPLCLSVLLSACGGAPADGSSNNPSSVINKPQVSSVEASSAPSSATASSVANSVATSTNTTSSNTSSLAISSADSYSRISRASSSNGNSSSSPVIDVDTTPPSATNLMLYRLSENSVTLIWDTATDNIGVSHYEIERDGNIVASIDQPINALADQQLLAHTDYHYTITAFDTAGNKSEKSPVFTVRTLANANSSHTNSSKSNTSSTNSSANSSASAHKTTVIRWNHPNKRENGQFLELDEIGGYEIRFKPPAYNNYAYIMLTGNRTTSFSTDLIPANSTIEIAVYDMNELYSSFTPISAEPD